MKALQMQVSLYKRRAFNPGLRLSQLLNCRHLTSEGGAFSRAKESYEEGEHWPLFHN